MFLRTHQEAGWVDELATLVLVVPLDGSKVGHNWHVLLPTLNYFGLHNDENDDAGKFRLPRVVNALRNPV